MIEPFTKHHVIEALGTQVAVHEAGDGPPVLFLHGNPDTHSVWAPVVERLCDRYRCIAPDLPGFGETRTPDSFDMALARQGAWVGAVIDALSIDGAHLVVHDVGGPYGLAFTAQHAERLRALTIMNTIFFPDYRWHFWARVWRTPLLGELSMKIVNKPLFVRELRRGSPKMTREYAEHAYAQLTPTSRKFVLRWYRAMDPGVFRGWDERLVAAIAQLPHQVIWGDCDPFIPATTADRFGGTVHHHTDLGHWAMIEDPARVASEIAALDPRQ